MEKKKTSFGEAVSGAGKNAVALFGKAKDTIVKAVDQNDDGSFNMKDVTAIADTIGSAAKTTATALKESADARSREMELKSLRPIFLTDLESSDFSLSKLIRIAEIDKKHAESELCKGAIGFISEYKGLRMVNIFSDKVDAFRLSFYPNMDCGVYYVDPSDRDLYIALDEYFRYLRIARVSELQKIAQDLGAKHFRVSFREMRVSTSNSSAKGKASAKSKEDGVSVEAEHERSESGSAKTDIAAEMYFVGQPPQEPVLKYLRNDPQVKNMIALRMSKNASNHYNYSIQLSNSSGMKESDAVRIDAALKGMKLSGNGALVREAQSESRSVLDYEIDF